IATASTQQYLPRRHRNASRVDTGMPPASTQECLPRRHRNASRVDIGMSPAIARLTRSACIADISPSGW
ncbi:hypothetical protein L211DRAFT_844000, partial [Terfezia boudieri ATCC MYA-4762]